MSIHAREFNVGYGAEKSVVVSADKNDRIIVHPWDRFGWESPREVFIAVGALTKTGDEKYEADDPRHGYQNVIVDRDDFVEAMLEVFPELERRSAGGSDA